VLVVGNQAWPASLDFINRQVNRLGIEFGVIQERQLTEPPELAIAASESPRKPIRNVDTDKPPAAASVENDGVERAKRRGDCWPRRDAGRLTTPHMRYSISFPACRVRLYREGDVVTM
jgi:hypothetical protein